MTSDQEERRSGRPVVLVTIALCVASYLAVNVLGSNALQAFAYRYLSLWPLGSGFTLPWQPLTYGYLHGGVDHLFFNMFALWMFGTQIENTVGSRRFLILYLAGLLAAALMQLLVQAVAGDTHPTIGASGAIFGLLMAYAVFFPNNRVMLIFLPIPMKAKWFVLLYALAELLLGLTGGIPTVAHFAHLGGVLGAAVVLWRWGWRPGTKWRA